MMAALTRRQVLILLLVRRRQFNRQKTHRIKIFWIRKIFQDRKTRGEFHCLVQDMKMFDHEMFFKQFRMLPSKFEELLSWVAPRSLMIARYSSKQLSFCVLVYTQTTTDPINMGTIERVIQAVVIRLWFHLYLY